MSFTKFNLDLKYIVFKGVTLSTSLFYKKQAVSYIVNQKLDSSNQKII